MKATLQARRFSHLHISPLASHCLLLDPSLSQLFFSLFWVTWSPNWMWPQLSDHSPRYILSSCEFGSRETRIVENNFRSLQRTMWCGGHLWSKADTDRKLKTGPTDLEMASTLAESGAPLAPWGPREGRQPAVLSSSLWPLVHLGPGYFQNNIELETFSQFFLWLLWKCYRMNACCICTLFCLQLFFITSEWIP